MTELTEQSRTPQAKRYRERAADARRNAASASGAVRMSFLTLADQWEGLAKGIEFFLRSGKRDEA